MGFLAMKSLFHKDSVNGYHDVLVPLQKAQHHPTVEAKYSGRRSTEGGGENGYLDDSKKKAGLRYANDSNGEEGVMRISRANYSPYTIEGLRAEIREDVAAASGHDSAYDCKLFWSSECLGG
jgi:hypothetical protein